MKLRQILFLIIIGISCLASNSIAAVELSILQKECAEIGFKIKTEDNGKCVLQLMDKFSSKATIQTSTKAIKQAIEIDDVSAAQQRTNERQQQYEKDAEIAQQQREIDALKKQQAQMYDLQKRSVAAQEQAAQAQAEGAADERRSRGLKLMNQGLDRMTGTGAYAPKASTSFSCIRNGNYTTCN